MSFENWRILRVRDICTKVISGGTPSTRNSEYYGGSIPWLKTQEVNFNRIYETETKITDAGYKNSSANWIPANSVIMAMYGATAGKIAINKIPITTNQACCNLIINDKIADYRYIFYNLMSRYQEIASMAVGGAQQNLNAEMIRDLEVPVPPLEPQHRIAEILSALDDKIELNRQTNATLEAIAQAIFKEWFVDFNYPGATGEVAESELGPIPNGWRVGTLGEILFLDHETISPGSFPNKTFFHYSIPAFDSGRFPSQEFGFQILSNKFKVKQNSILVSKLNPRIPRIWPIKKVDEANSICSTEFLVLTPAKPSYYSYALNLLSQSSIRETMRSRASGTSSSHQRISPKDLLSIMISIPSDDLITLFDRIVGDYFHYIGNSLDEMINLSTIRDRLLPYLLNSQNSVGNEN